MYVLVIVAVMWPFLAKCFTVPFWDFRSMIVPQWKSSFCWSITAQCFELPTRVFVLEVWCKYNLVASQWWQKDLCHNVVVYSKDFLGHYTVSNMFTRWLLCSLAISACRITNSAFGCTYHITLHWRNCQSSAHGNWLLFFKDMKKI